MVEIEVYSTVGASECQRLDARTDSGLRPWKDVKARQKIRKVLEVGSPIPAGRFYDFELAVASR